MKMKKEHGDSQKQRKVGLVHTGNEGTNPM